MKIPSTLAGLAMAFAVLSLTHAAEPAKPPAAIPMSLFAADGELRLIAPRDGFASSSAVLRGPKIAGVAVTAPHLTGPGGAVLPPEAVQVRFLSGDQFTPTPAPGQYTEGRAVLGQQQSIVLTVRAPKAAAAGVYAGWPNEVGRAPKCSWGCHGMENRRRKWLPSSRRSLQNGVGVFIPTDMANHCRMPKGNLSLVAVLKSDGLKRSVRPRIWDGNGQTWPKALL